ncbi:NrfD/PsrC family molybdoenzyme membrane anchor subunit [Halorhodospira halophila]|uniref:Polysulphide reductase, NrfD n=1 Tax=Halorhodospira halophila (strain DSM 244 / SL1) TaxID=349124 RepID=A1WYG4_HALHL|nr:NrfD/PsrC family molybdoenzyme membrane anchor subunit [Halorhodospira halophila]ABM62726.1 Polysulphide reductase, NrfD [Halorhodospira halophila SL1]
MAARIRYQHLGTRHPLRWAAALAGAGLLTLIGAAAGLYLIVAGHHLTGMGQQVVWGWPHVVAIGLILAGSGAFALAALAPTTLGHPGEPWARLGTVAAAALLIGGLAVLSLDLGSPQRILPPLELNLMSSFSRNLFLYTAFLIIALLYLATLLEPRLRRFAAAAGGLAAAVAVLLALNVGSIFAMLAARPVFGGAIMMPLFLAAALTLGTATLSLIWLAVLRAQGQEPPPRATGRLGALLLIAVLALAALLALHFLTLAYQPGHREIARFLLVDGGVYPVVFWIGVVAVGIITPTLLLLRKAARARGQALAWASGVALIGGFAHLFVMIVGAQAFPLQIFPGREVEGAVFDGEAASYLPSAWEALLGLAGPGLALLILLLALRALPLTAVHFPGEPAAADGPMAAADAGTAAEPSQ